MLRNFEVVKPHVAHALAQALQATGVAFLPASCHDAGGEPHAEAPRGGQHGLELGVPLQGILLGDLAVAVHVQHLGHVPSVGAVDPDLIKQA